jgi:hypothetical protein
MKTYMIFLISISLQKEKKLPKKFFSFLHEEKVKTKIKKIKSHIRGGPHRRGRI